MFKSLSSVEGLYCKRPIQCLASSEILTPPPTPPGECVPRVSTEVTFWHSAEYGSDFWLNSGEIPRNSAEFRGISPELNRNPFRSQKIPRNSVSAEFRGHPMCTPPPAFGAWGGHTRWVERGWAGQFWKTPDTALYSTYVSTLFYYPFYSNCNNPICPCNNCLAAALC